MKYNVIFMAAAVATRTSMAPTNSVTLAIPTKTMFDEGVPTDQPVVGDYTGALRPQIHFSPPTEFMNDPNGMFVDVNGTYHLYYQYNPTATVAGNQHWGHATSTDLYHWVNQKIAIFATEDSQIFSGSCVIDTNNTSGFFPGQDNGVVAIYTLNTATAQTQEIAWSVDGGYTFEKYEGNPVLALDPPSSQFRDPKVVRYDDHWVMVLAYAQEFAIGIFTSPDLKSWTHASNFSHHGLLGLQYECPNLVEMPVEGGDPMWVMAISINPGAPLGGSITEYFPGEFNGTHFTAIDAAARLTDFSKDNYAGQFFYGIPPTEEQIYIGWASNWEYSQAVPTGQLEGWRSSMTVPRRTHIANVTRVGINMMDMPYNIEAVLDAPLATNSSLGNGTVFVDYSSLNSGAIWFQVNVTGLPNNTATPSRQGTLNFTFSASSTRESVSGGFYFGGDNPFWMNRGDIYGFGNTDPFFTDKFSVGNPINANGTFTLDGIIDRSILEAFIDNGRSVGTMTFFPQGMLDTMVLRTNGLNDGVEVSVAVWGLKSAWAEEANDEGVVEGNVTMSSNNPTMDRRHAKLY
ncbi:putative invertase 4 [Amylocarpus encephaloides]|uniref:Invertase 4 n=1 Tax=Amylocarpus encephaloides TaxID=45428 RepID=A0A9P7YR70_9HELO|nr:putative invertase 4 [Amylocarpus encephaloides]